MLFRKTANRACTEVENKGMKGFAIDRIVLIQLLLLLCLVTVAQAQQGDIKYRAGLGELPYQNDFIGKDDWKREGACFEAAEDAIARFNPQRYAVPPRDARLRRHHYSGKPATAAGHRLLH